jgi:2'-5' RNA ligase
MILPDLKHIYKVVNWHQTQRDHKPGESVGVFITIPEALAKQFPEDGKKGHDTSPAHITVLYCGDLPLLFEDKLKEVVKGVCEQIKPFNVSLKRPDKFINHKNETIIHSPVKSKKLHAFNGMLKNALLLNQVPVENKHPEYKPHITIRYLNENEEDIYNDPEPVGEWMVDSVWIWGGKSPYLVYFGK